MTHPQRASLLHCKSHLPTSHSDLKPQCHLGSPSPASSHQAVMSPHPCRVPLPSFVSTPKPHPISGLSFLLLYLLALMAHLLTPHHHLCLELSWKTFTLPRHSPMKSVQHFPAGSWIRVHTVSKGFKMLPSPAPIRPSTPVLVLGPCSPTFLGLWGPFHHHQLQNTASLPRLSSHKAIMMPISRV